MRLAIALAAVMLATAGANAQTGCIARVHKGAIPWDVDFDSGDARPADTSGRSGRLTRSEVEVAGVLRDGRGSLWVERAYEATWKLSDVDLRGDCRRAFGS